MHSKVKNIVLMASGSGSNVENIVRHFESNPTIRFPLVLCNNPRAGVLERCARLGLPSITFNRHAFDPPTALLALLEAADPDLIVLAGFLWKLPAELVDRFEGRIVNIHPSLLPRHGGKGMYGMRVHEAVLAAGDPESGISIHLVDEHYDRGKLLLQVRTAIPRNATAADIAARVHSLEMEHYPKVIESLLG